MEGHREGSTLKGKVEPVLSIFLKEESNFLMILVLQVLNNRLTAKISLLEDLVDSLEVVPNQGLFE